MKKILIPVLFCFLVSANFMFADDAKVMPGRVGRIYAAPTFAFANGKFDGDGEYQEYGDGEGALKAINLGFAAEYGIIDWITAAVQWAPGWTPWSDVDMAGDVNVNGLADIFAGAKIQIIGENAPVKTSRFRLALAPGVKIPLPGPDFEEEARKMGSGDTATAGSQDKHVFGAGVRGYFDYIVNEYFFINLYSEFIYFPIKGDAKKAGLNEYGTIATAATIFGLPGIPDAKVNYGYDLTFELEPVFTLPLAQGISFSAGLPVNYKLTPGKKYDVDVPDNLKSTFTDALETGNTYIFSLKPNASVFFSGLKLPAEFKLSYSIPILGKNERATHSVTLQAKLYFRI
jgi:hypothetical protein